MTTATKPKKNKYKSGFCNDINKTPQCEGTKPVTRDGTPMPVCLDWENCPCKCHELVTQMYEMAEMEREPAEQSAEYLALQHERSAQLTLMLDSVYALTVRSRALSSSDGPDVHPGDEGPFNGTPSAQDGPVSTLSALVPARPVFTRTPTGRRARGQLEYDVLQVCREYAEGVWEWEACTPKAVAEQIGKMNSVEPPSTGAINAVWDRWEKIGFAEQAKKPSRFVKFTGENTDMALDRMKGATKRAKKMAQAEQKRGVLRPRGR